MTNIGFFIGASSLMNHHGLVQWVLRDVQGRYAYTRHEKRTISTQKEEPWLAGKSDEPEEHGAMGKIKHQRRKRARIDRHAVMPDCPHGKIRWFSTKYGV
jgi:hypothetical protein